MLERRILMDLVLSRELFVRSFDARVDGSMLD